MDKLKQAKDFFDKVKPRSAGSAGRESAEKQRKRDRILRDLGAGPTISVERIPNAKMIMPSTESMMREGEMDLVNYPKQGSGYKSSSSPKQRAYETSDKLRLERMLKEGSMGQLKSGKK
jgi:hypothetical protein